MIADGKQVASLLKEQIINNLSKASQKKVCFIIFGNDPGSRQFINMKCRFAEGLGIKAIVSEHPENVTFTDVKRIIDEITLRNYSGIVIQLPLPKNLDTDQVLNLVPVDLDIDVLSENAKRQYKLGQTDKVPPVSRAVEEIIKYHGIDLSDKKILIIGSGKLVGEPVSNMLSMKKINYAQIDKNTDPTKKDELLKTSDIIISGAGDSHFIKPDMIKEGVILIDAGTSESEGKIVGDVDPDCFPKALLVTPVPGGVGPVTLSCLFLNI
ncbi:MAG: bifunctional 5,10-methylenetetrahydrofolate dehydrogenase/5,10-methenyltetrahydrofolate cyclohydrolase [Minisyncoccia bacterium]